MAYKGGFCGVWKRGGGGWFKGGGGLQQVKQALEWREKRQNDRAQNAKCQEKQSGTKDNSSSAELQVQQHREAAAAIIASETKHKQQQYQYLS